MSLDCVSTWQCPKRWCRPCGWMCSYHVARTKNKLALWQWVKILGKNPFKEVFTSYTVILLNNISHNDIFMPVYSNICCSSPNHSLSLTPHLLAVPSSLVLLRVFLFFVFVGGPVSVIVVTYSEGLFIGAWATLRNLEEGQGLMCLPHPHNDGMFTYPRQVFK